MTTADLYRKDLIRGILTENTQKNNRLNIEFKGNKGVYTEVLTLDEINSITENFTSYPNVESFFNEFVEGRLNEVLDEFGYMVNESKIDVNSSDFYDGYQMKVPIRRKPYNTVEELFTEIDTEMNPEPEEKEEPEHHAPAATPAQSQSNYLPNAANRKKTQNPKKVDLVLKTVFESKFSDYSLQTDIGKWKVVKTLKKGEKLAITWESQRETSILIETIIFPKDTNKVVVDVKNRSGQVLLQTFFEIYRIPTDEFLAEKFFRKTFFTLLKKYIDTNVVQVDPFKFDFVFWKTDNPNFSYSFSTPSKNKIIMDLISFISTAKKPILDDFFEQNNLKHKQGYLQTLLDSAEAAGIFKFQREGNEILILRGPNYKAFLQGKVRRVVF